MRAVFGTVAAASGSQGLLQDNPNRGGIVFFSQAYAAVHITLAPTATLANSTVTLQFGEKISIPGYTGQASALFDPFEGGYTGSLNITEITN